MNKSPMCGEERKPTMTDQANPQRQFVAVLFKPWDQRSYTYHNDGEPVAIGDSVIVETAKGTQTVTVSALPTAVPPFPTKPIIGKAPPEGEAPAGEPPAAQPMSRGPLPF
jgi:hypothetical protein